MKRQFTTPAQAEAARNNGSKSQGPKTPEGKRRSALNAINHGYYTGHLLLPNEDPAVLDMFRKSYYERFRPTDGVELSLVEEILAAQWRMMRIREAQEALINAEMVDAYASIGHLESAKEAGRTSLAFDALDQSNPTFYRLSEIEARLQRIYTRAVKNLYLIRNTPYGPSYDYTGEPDTDTQGPGRPHSAETNPSPAEPSSNQQPAAPAPAAASAKAAAATPYRCPELPIWFTAARFIPFQPAQKPKVMAAGASNPFPSDE